MKTDAIPGRAVMNPSTTRRRLGTVEIRRKTRKIRNARIAEKPWVAGIKDTATIRKSKMFHPSRKNRARYTISLASSSATKIPRHTLSSSRIKLPARAMIVLDVSIPSKIALKIITHMMNVLKRGDLINRSRGFWSVMGPPLANSCLYGRVPDARQGPSMMRHMAC